MHWHSALVNRIIVKFQAWGEVPENYVVCVVGTGAELGNWHPHKAVVLTRRHGQWERSVLLRRGRQYFYRFFVCKPLWSSLYSSICFTGEHINRLSMEDSPGISILYWESRLTKRGINTHNLPPYVVTQMAELPINIEYQREWSKGWLYELTEVRLRLKGKKPVALAALKDSNFKLYIKCLPTDATELYQRRVNLGKIGVTPSSNHALISLIKIGSLPLTTFMKTPTSSWQASSNDSSFRPHFATEITMNKLGALSHYAQQNEMTSFTNGEFLTCCCGTTSLKTLGFRFEFFIGEKTNLEFAGFSYLVPVKEAQTSRTVPIFNRKCTKVGVLEIDLFLITPLRRVHQDMEISFQSYRKLGRQEMEAVPSCDRGRERSSPKTICTVSDNTMASLKAAAGAKVDFVEFDVQLCRDQIPVVYHSFEVLTTGQFRFPSHLSVYKCAIQDMLLSQLQKARLSQRNVPGVTPSEAKDAVLFPTLIEVLTTLPTTLGCLINVKYPQVLQETGKIEVENYINHNETVDTILTDVFNSGTTRKIIFTSSNPDTCIMIQRKQNRYPVIFRSLAGCLSSQACEDPRTMTFNAAIHFALTENLLGISVSAHALLHHLSLVHEMRKKYLVLLVWDDADHSTRHAETLCRNRVDGLVTHHIRSTHDQGPLNLDLLHLSEPLDKLTNLASQLITHPVYIPPDKTAHTLSPP